MKTSERIDRNVEIVTFLATPRRDKNGDLVLVKDKLSYPTHREVGEMWNLDKYQIGRIKKSLIDLYNKIKAEASN